MSSRRNVLSDRHVALGADLSAVVWNEMGLPQNYHTDPYEETAAVRYRAGLFDVSALRNINVTGKDAVKFLNRVLTTDISKAVRGDSHISNIVDASGGLIDDVIVYVDGPTEFRVSHGGGKLDTVFAAEAGKYDVKIEPDHDLHILALQGPLALDVLSPHTPYDLASLAYFRHVETKLFGKNVRIARGGYSAERGYEVFCSSKDAPELWDEILKAGKDRGVIPVSWACLDIVRVEGGLLFFPYDMPYADTTPWEVKAGWSIDLEKPDFIGKAALVTRKGKERSFIAGLEVLTDRAIAPGSKVLSDGKEVGVVTSTTYSRHLMKSLAMAHVVPSNTRIGTELTIIDRGEWSATVAAMPFYDPLRRRTHPEGANS